MPPGDSKRLEQEGKLLAVQGDARSTGVTSVDYPKYFYQVFADALGHQNSCTKVADLALKLYRAQAFEEAWDSKSHLWNSPAKAIDKLFLPRERPNLSN